MGPGRIIDGLSPHAQVATALIPFLAAILCRLIFGKNRTTQLLLSLATTWFAVNVLLAPYSIQMRREVIAMRNWFR